MCRLGELPAGAKVKIDGCWYVVKDQQENKTLLEQVGFCNNYEDCLCSIRFNDKPLKLFIDEDILGKGKENEPGRNDSRSAQSDT